MSQGTLCCASIGPTQQGYTAKICLLLGCLLAGCATSPSTPPASTVVLPAEVLNPDVRPDTSYTNGVKLKLLPESGTDAANASKYELDHVIPLAVGGHPRNIKNLMLQPRDGEDGAKKKDRLERRLQQLVWSKLLSLRDAQAAIWTDWQAAYRRQVLA